MQKGFEENMGVILPTDQHLTFVTHLTERIEITSGKYFVRRADQEEIEIYRSEAFFIVSANSRFSL